MNNTTYWHKQTAENPLYKDFEWNKPERQSERGKLGIIGGQSSGFIAVAESYNIAKSSKIGQVRVLLPDSLKKTVPISSDEVVFSMTNSTGGLSKEAESDVLALIKWSDICLMIGDSGKSSETAICYENTISKTESPIIITRDAVDLLLNSVDLLLSKPNVALVLSFAQMQKLFKNCYYPIILSFNMQLTQLVEALHKFTITYPISICVYYQSSIVIASGGEVTTTKFEKPMDIWRGITATKMALNWIYKKEDPLQCFTAAVI